MSTLIQCDCHQLNGPSITSVIDCEAIELNAFERHKSGLTCDVQKCFLNIMIRSSIC